MAIGSRLLAIGKLIWPIADSREPTAQLVMEDEQTCRYCVPLDW